MENCYKALKTSGEIVIFDFAYPERLGDFRNQEYAPSIKDQFYEVTWGTEHINRSEKNRILVSLGFKDPVTNSLFGGPVEVTYATK